MVRDGYYYALGAAMAALVLGWLAKPAWAIVPLLLGAFFLWFFRDPERVSPAVAGAIVSAADGKVTEISPLLMDGRPQTRISVFLSVFDVHVNRSPIAGVIRKVEHRPGRFLNAMSGRSAEVNEQNVVSVEGEGQIVVFKQIAGVLARRIVFAKRAGDTVARGERVGMIKFGSRTDVIIPQDCDLEVKVGDHVRGGETVLAIVRSLAEATEVRAGERALHGGR